MVMIVCRGGQREIEAQSAIFATSAIVEVALHFNLKHGGSYVAD